MPHFMTGDSCRIFYECFGESGPLVMLIPGLGGDGRFWNGIIPALSARYRIVTVDHRGAGRSDRPDDIYSIGRVSEDFAELAAMLDEPIHFVGHSTGGAIVQTLALDYSLPAASFTISSSWARADRRFQELFQARAEMLERGLAKAYQRLTHIFGHEADYIEAHREKLERAVEDAPNTLAPLAVSARRVRMLLEHNRLADLPGIVAPVLVMAGSGDILTPLYLSKQVADAIPGAHFQVLAGAHFHPLARPEQFAEALMSFLADNHHDQQHR